MDEKLEKIQQKIQAISDGLAALQKKSLEIEKENEKLKEALKRVYEYKIRNRRSKNAGKHKGDL